MRTLLLFACAAIVAAPTGAQDRAGVAYSSATYFLTAIELASGDEADSFVYKLQPALGTGVVVEPSDGSIYSLRGGFPSMLSSAPTGSPMLAGVTPFFLGPTGGPSAVIAGYDLLVGGSPTVTVGGLSATVTQWTTDHVTVTVPDQPVPGFQPVTITNGLGTAQLERGVAVLPMLFNPEPLNLGTPVRATFVGTQGDFVLLALSFGRLPAPMPLLGALYGLVLDPNLVIATAVVSVTNTDGTWVLQAPPLPVVGQLYFQALALTANPSYAPWSWTNDIIL